MNRFSLKAVVMVLLVTAGIGPRINSQSPDTTQFAQLRAEIDRLKLQRDIWDLRKGLFQSYIPNFDLPQATSHLVVDDSIPIEARAFLWQQTESLAVSIARDIAPRLDGHVFRLHSHERSGLLRSYGAFLAHLQYLEHVLQSTLAVARPSRVPANFMGTPDIAAALPSLLKSTLTLVDVFRTKVEIQNRALPTDTSAFLALVAKHLPVGLCILPERSYSASLPLRENSSSQVGKLLFSLLSLKQLLDKKIGDIAVVSTKPEKNAATSNGNVRLFQIQKTMEDFLTKVFTSDSSVGSSPFADLLLAEASILLPQSGDTIQYVLDARLTQASYAREKSSSLISGDKVKYAIQVGAIYILTDNSGAIVQSNAFLRTTGYTKGKDIVIKSK